MSDPSAILKQMSKGQIQKLLRDPDIVRILSQLEDEPEVIVCKEFELKTEEDYIAEHVSLSPSSGVGLGNVNYDNLEEDEE